MIRKWLLISMIALLGGTAFAQESSVEEPLIAFEKMTPESQHRRVSQLVSNLLHSCSSRQRSVWPPSFVHDALNM